MAARATKGVGFFRRLWHEKPDIAASCLLLPVGAVAVAYQLLTYEKETYHQHRWEYTVIRAEDADPAYEKKNAYN